MFLIGPGEVQPALLIGYWLLEFVPIAIGIWNLEFGIWDLGFGIWLLPIVFWLFVFN